MNGALLINKPAGLSSFGVIEELQRALVRSTGLKKRDLPKLGHGGTLDPFATGLLVVCVGDAVKLARYFLDSVKGYRGIIRFGETTVPGDPTAPVSETSDVLPQDIEQLRELATRFADQPYLQTPPMHSAKKLQGKPLYELARKGEEVEREPKLCHLYRFEISEFVSDPRTPRARFDLSCSSGTYVRTLAQDFARLLGTVALLEELERTASGSFRLEQAMKLDEIRRATDEGRPWNELSCWVPFDQMLSSYPRASATAEEAQALFQGRQNVLPGILRRAEDGSSFEDAPGQPKTGCVAIYHSGSLIAVSRQENGVWGLERVFMQR